MYRTVLGQEHHSVYTNLDQLACFIQAHVGNFDFHLVNVQVTVALDQGDFSSLRSLPQSVERECHQTAYANIEVHTTYANIQVHTATDALTVYASVLQFCQSLSTSSCRCNSSDLRVVHASSPEPWILATLKRRVFPVCFRR